jgi:hypothetical protein
MPDNNQPPIADAAGRAAHYWRQIEAEATHLLSDDRPAALERMSGDYPNYLAALRHFMDSGEPEPTSRLVRALRMYWEVTHQHAEGRAWIATALGRPEFTPRTPARAMLLDHAACLAASAGDFDAARAGWQECLSIRREHGPAPLLPVTLCHAGMGQWIGAHDLPAARAAFEECVRLCKAQGNTRMHIFALHWLARVSIDEQALAQATALLDRADALSGADPSWAPWSAGGVMQLRAVIAARAGQPDLAQSLFAQGAALKASHGLPDSELPPHEHAWFRQHLGAAYPTPPA